MGQVGAHEKTQGPREAGTLGFGEKSKSRQACSIGAMKRFMESWRTSTLIKASFG